MPFLIVAGERLALEIGETVLGGPDADELLREALGDVPAFAVITTTPDHVSTIRAAGTASDARLDGAPLTSDPRALRHGSRIESAGRQLLFGDLRQVGSTSQLAGVPDDVLAELGRLAGEPTSDTGGRLTATADGREYRIPESGLEIGRDPECGVVIDSMDVSRRHAIITPSLLGYTITDRSTNGVLVNGARVDGTRVLSRGDVVRIGPCELRFDAEGASFEPAAELRDGGAGAAEPTGLPSRTSGGDQDPEGARSGAADQGSPGAPGAHVGATDQGSQPAPYRTKEVTPRQQPPVAPLLATLEVISTGVAAGKRFRIERPVAHVGRGAHNDVVLADSSVSSSHAVLQRRRDGWFVVDAGSTNGTYVEGERVQGERRLGGACELRFGNIKLVFRPIGAGAATGEASGGTKAIAGIVDA